MLRLSGICKCIGLLATGDYALRQVLRYNELLEHVDNDLPATAPKRRECACAMHAVQRHGS